MSTREDIAAAVSTVEGVNVTPFHRQSLKTGDGFVRLSVRTRPSNGFGWIDTWEVWIAVPAGIAAAEKWIDEKADALLEALAPEMQVQTMTPFDLTVGPNTTIPGIVVSGVREG
jgi:hypothetical protein